MALASNALTTVESLLAYMGRPIPDRSQLAIFHDQSVSATACTVAVSSTLVTIVITSGANAGTTTYTFAANTTVTAMVTALNAAAIGLVARVVGTGNSSSDELTVEATTDCYGSSAEQILRGRDDYAYEQAINAASNRIEKLCGRIFAEATYRQAYNGNQTESLRLHYYPVSDVIRVSIGKIEGLDISNGSNDSHDATFRLDGTNITLDLHGGANKGTDDVAISTNTIATLAATITALGKDWTASASSTEIGTLPGTELLKAPATGCLGNTETLYVPDQNEIETIIESETGILKRRIGNFFRAFYGYGHGYYLPTITPGRVTHHSIWPDGQFNIIVKYKAGYATIPIEIEMLCNEGAASIIRAGMRDSNLTSESAAGYSQSNAETLWSSEGFLRELSQYRAMPGMNQFEDV